MTIKRSQVGTQFCYTKGQLDLLAQCLEINDGLASGLFVFFDTAKLSPTPEDVISWLRFAEHIQRDPEYISKLFRQTALVSAVT